MFLFYFPLLLIYCAVFITVQFFGMGLMGVYYSTFAIVVLLPYPAYLMHVKMKDPVNDLYMRNLSNLKQLSVEGRLLTHATARSVDEAMIVKKFAFISAYLQHEFVPMLVPNDDAVIAIRQVSDDESVIYFSMATLASCSQEEMVIESVIASLLISKSEVENSGVLGFLEASIGTFILVRRIEAVMGLSSDKLTFDLDGVGQLLDFEYLDELRN